MNYLIGILILFACCGLGSTQGVNNTTSLLCYFCNPLVYGAVACANPARNNVPLLNCTTTVTGNVSNWRFSCHSSFLNYANATANGISRNNETGIYRDCVSTPVTSSNTQCSQSPGTNVTLVSCMTCTISGCNTHTFGSGGNITGGGSNGPGAATTTIPSIFLFLLCGIFPYCKSYLSIL